MIEIQNNENNNLQFEDRILKYNQTLKDGQNKLRIYPWGQLEFDEIYVVPSLSRRPEADEEPTNVNGENIEAQDYKNAGAETAELSEYTNPNYQCINVNENTSLPVDIFEKGILSEETEKHILVQEDTILFRESKQAYTTEDKLQRMFSWNNSMSIWEILMIEKYNEGKTFGDMSFFSQRLREKELFDRKKQISEMFKNDNIVYVIGGAGYGKSLFLRKLCVNPELLNGFTERPLLIIRGEIKRLIRNDGTHRSLIDFLEESFTNNSLCDSHEINHGFITECLKAGRCLLLLDALDEVSNEHRDAIHDLIISQFINIFPGNKVCITSRERGFIPRKNISCFYIRAVTPEDVETYVDRFIAIYKFEKQNKAGFVTEATELVKKKFVKGFLTLSLLLAIYHKEGELPNNKLQLYEKCFEYISNQREKQKDMIRNSLNGQNYNWEHLDIFLTDETFLELAKCGTPNNVDISERSIKRLLIEMYQLKFQSYTSCKLAIEEFLQFCSDRTEVFVPSQSSNSDYCFYHRSFYEYFYTKYVEKYAKNEEEMCDMLKYFDMDSEIYELLTMYFKDEGSIDRISSLAKYLFIKAQKSLQNATDMNDRSFDMLTMLMHAFTDGDYLHQYDDFILKNAEILSGRSLTVNFAMLSTIMKRSISYYTKQFWKDEQNCFAVIQARVLRYCLSHSKECNAMLKKIKGRKYEGITIENMNTQKQFTYNMLILVLPNCYELFDQLFIKLADRKYLIAVERLQNREVNILYEFASKLNEIPAPDRIQAYHYLILKA